jgi:DDE superfamily endonuclease
MRAHDVKNHELKPWLRKQWVIPPQADAEFVCAMADVLEGCTRPYDPTHPVVCPDEISKQLVAETRTPLPAEPGQPERVDYGYERCGTANRFMTNEPLTGHRHVTVTERRTAVDCAREVRDLLEVRYPHAEKVVLVMDHLNTHKPAARYQAFEPKVARSLIDRLEIHHTPKHGSWLNMAEIALGILSRQCLDRRIPDADTLTREVAAWEQARNASPRPVHWRFTTPDARIKLKRLYPSIQDG